jgi:hypothetical protein
MSSIEVSDEIRQKLEELSRQFGRPMGDVLTAAIEEYHRAQFWTAVNQGYAALRADPAAWAEIEAERELWDATLADGLDEEYPS